MFSKQKGNLTNLNTSNSLQLTACYLHKLQNWIMPRTKIFDIKEGDDPSINFQKDSS